MRATVLVLTVFLLSGCSGGEEPSLRPGAPGGSAPTVVSITPGPRASAAAAVRSGAKGDLSIALGGDCLIQKDRKNALWLKLPLAASWIGTTFPATSYSVTADRGGQPAGSALNSSQPIIAMVGGDPVRGNRFLGQKVVLTVTVDPANRVAEVSESNNIVKIDVTVPATAPSDNGEHPVPCR